MMISPEAFAEEYKGETLKELRKIRDELIEEIRDYEKAPRGKAQMDPSPEVIYHCDLLYLAKICELIAEKVEGDS